VVTFLFTDIEGSTRRWEADADGMRAALAAHDAVLREAIDADGGWLFKHTGDGVCAAFASPRSAVDAAVAAQRVLELPVRMGLATGEAELRGADYFGAVLNRAARVMAAGHGGQILLAESTAVLVSGVDLLDLGTHPLRDLPRPERVMQLCHPDLRNEFPPLHTPKLVGAQNLPVQLTSFVGRGTQMTDVRKLLADNRLVTLSGAGGAGKTRLAVEIATRIAPEYADGVWYVDLAPITDPVVVPVTVTRALGLPDQPGGSTMDTLLRFLRDRHVLVVLDNCEHLLGATAELVVALLGAAPRLRLLATSREPIGVPGEATWRVPSLSVADEAIELFADRARLTRTDFSVTDDNVATMTEICERLDGMPLAIELAAARVRALSLAEIRDGLRDRFRLLTGGARTAVRRQQTLRASVDWSHALLTQPERVLFRRLAVFLGGFDLDGAQAVAGGGDVERYQVLDLLTLLVDKSLVVAEEGRRATRYRMLETVRQYAQEKLGESREADVIRTQHRDFYVAMAAHLEPWGRRDNDWRIEQMQTEIDNLRAAFAWSRERGDIALALQFASSMQPLWAASRRIQEGLSWLNAALADEEREVAPAVRARALIDRAMLDMTIGVEDNSELAEQALAIARRLDDRTLLIHALWACAGTTMSRPKVAGPLLAEAIDLARESGRRAMLSQLLGWRAYAACIAGDPITARLAAEEGRDLAQAVGNRFGVRFCRTWLGYAQTLEGDVVAATAAFGELVSEAEAEQDVVVLVCSLVAQGRALAYQGQTKATLASANAAIEVSNTLGGILAGLGHAVLATAALAEGDVAAAQEATDVVPRYLSARYKPTMAELMAQVALARGDVTAARALADDAVNVMRGCHLMLALTTRVRVAIAQGERERAERDAHDALEIATGSHAHLGLPDIFECLAVLACEAGSCRQAARLFGAAHSVRQRMGVVRFKVWDAGYEASVAAVRDALGEQEFDSAWAEGAALSTEEAIAYAQRGRGERKRPTSGWDALTPTERDVVRLVSDGLGNKDIATRLFVSPRTVQTHLTHVYTKLGLTSRVQLAKEAARHA
jgi:predicted ATPase/DNA-binding CsgD family transcriptional regulator